MLKVGLTGGIASGKSIVGEMFSALGTHLLRADQIAHELMQPGEPVYRQVVERFGGMYRAFQYGAPPHGGMAAGVDRIVMLLCSTTNLREISLFPMNQQAVDLLMGAPSEVSAKQLRELHIRLNLPKKE